MGAHSRVSVRCALQGPCASLGAGCRKVSAVHRLPPPHVLQCPPIHSNLHLSPLATGLGFHVQNPGWLWGGKLPPHRPTGEARDYDRDRRRACQ